MSGLFRAKVILAAVKVLDESQGRVHAVVSTEGEDRDGDVIRADGWNLENFRKHPVLLSSHDYRSLRSQIGEWEEMRVVDRRLEGIARYYVGEGNPDADWGFKLAARGKAAYSVGFIPDMGKAVERQNGERRGLEFRGQELLEVSHVTIPANAEALQSLRTLSLHPAVAELVDELLEGPDGAATAGEIGNLPLLTPEFPAGVKDTTTWTVNTTTTSLDGGALVPVSPAVVYLSDEQLERVAAMATAKLMLLKHPRPASPNPPELAAALTQSIRNAWRTQ